MPRAKKGKTAEALVTPTGGKVDLRRIIGAPLVPEPEIPELPEDRIAALKRRLSEVRNPEVNRYQSDFYTFLTELVYTKDESRAGQVAKFPDHPYIKEACDALMREPLLVVEKSRRVLMSWMMCALDLWLVAGGQDPRWVDNDGVPVLMRSKENRQVILAARKLEDIQGSAWFLEQRVKFIYDQFVKRGFHQYWADFPEIEWSFAKGRAANGGNIDAVPQGADQMRGPGATQIHAEECAFWPAAKASIQGALPVTLGGGHFTGITTANAASYMSEVVREETVPSPVSASPEKRLLPLRHTTSGWAILTVPHSVVPGYDLKAACRGLTEEQIRMEIFIDWQASPGKRVFPEFSRDLHVSTEDLVFDPRSTLYVGWDWGQYPAATFSQLNVFGQWLVFPSMAPKESETAGIYPFAERVAHHLQREYALPYDLDLEDLRLVHIGDPAGQARPPRVGERPKETRSCFEILRKGIEIHLGVDDRGDAVIERKPGWGWKVIPGAVNVTDRLEAIRSRLTTTLRDGIPAIVIDHRATLIIEGFLGGYHYESFSDGTYGRSPEKNYHSHTMDALQYPATKLFAKAKHVLNEDEEEDRPKRQPFQSHASPRY